MFHVSPTKVIFFSLRTLLFVLLDDNLKAHRCPNVVAVIAASPHIHVPRPSYSPDDAAIECVYYYYNYYYYYYSPTSRLRREQTGRSENLF